jgi:hypothetical protein
MIESVLCRRNVRPFAVPNLQRRLLNGAGKRKRQRPRQPRLESDIHGIQTRRGQFWGLSARQEHNPGNRGGNRSQQTIHRSFGDLVHCFLLGAGQSWEHHVGLQDQPFQLHALGVKLAENRSQDFFG